MSVRYPIILGGMSALLAATAIVVFLGVRGLYAASAAGPAGDTPEDFAAWEEMMRAWGATVEASQPLVGHLVLAAAIPAIAAIALLAVRAQRASASATASRDAS